MRMDHDEFVSKYMSEETEAIPTKYLKPNSHSYFDDGPILCCHCH